MQWQDFESFIRHLSSADRDRVHRAFDLCESAHAGQLRKSGEPYSIHPVAVALLIAAMGADADSLVAALLHDALEDTDLTLESVRQKFGETAAALIDGMTKLDDESMRQHPTLDEEIESLRKMMLLMKTDVRIMVIKLADRLHNMRTVEFLSPERQRSFAQETMDVYVKIAERMGMQDMSEELEALCLQILEPALFTRLKEAHARNAEWGEKMAEEMRTVLYREPLPLATSVVLIPECKTWDHLRARLDNEEAAVSGRSDITITFLCNDITQCYETLGILHQQWPHEILSFKDFINAPAVNGYRGLHTTIILPNGARVRCKIRTQEMHDYARKGVTALCFNRQAAGLLDSLPWTERIAPLSHNTRDVSRQFWDSLQSDILGKSILIYGPDGTAVQLPAGATALDGAFALFKEKTLRTKAIKVNGKEVSFFSPLVRSVSLEVEFADEPTATRDWLEWTHTGMAIAFVREFLSSISRQKKIESGRRILQEIMTKQARGYLKEFSENSLLTNIRSLGFTSMEETFIAIAEGQLQPASALAALFPAKDRGSHTDQRICTVRFIVPSMPLREIPERFLFVENKYRITLSSFNMSPINNQSTRITVKLPLSEAEQQSIAAELREAGATSIQIIPSQSRIHFVGIALLILLWGLDPVFTKMILLTGIPPMSFSFIRAWTIVLFASLVLLLTQRRRRFSRIPLDHPSLWIAGIAFGLINVLTYLTLNHHSPVAYNTILRGNAILLSAPLFLRHRLHGKLTLMLLLGIGGLLALFFSTDTSPSFLLVIGVLVAFSIYTAASTRFQRDARVLARYPQFLFATSLIAAICLACLIPFMIPAEFPGLVATLLLALYCTGFIGMTYIMFFSLTRQIGYYTISPWINFSLVVTLFGQMFFLQHLESFTVIAAAVALIAGSLIASQISERITTSSLAPTLP